MKKIVAKFDKGGSDITARGVHVWKLSGQKTFSDKVRYWKLGTTARLPKFGFVKSCPKKWGGRSLSDHL